RIVSNDLKAVQVVASLDCDENPDRRGAGIRTVEGRSSPDAPGTARIGIERVLGDPVVAAPDAMKRFARGAPLFQEDAKRVQDDGNRFLGGVVSAQGALPDDFLAAAVASWRGFGDQP